MNSFKNYLGKILLLTFISLIGFQSCKKELEINADYKAIPIIYGFLNQYDSLQIIKVNKSFLGNEDPKNYAGIQDSSLFQDVNLSLIEIENGVEKNSYPLQKYILNNKEPGVFSNPENVVYGAALPRVKSQTNAESIKFLRESTIGTDGNVENRITYELRGTLNNDINIKASLTPIPEYPADVFTQRSFQSKWKPNAIVGSINFATSTGFTDGLLFDVELPPFVKIAELKMIFHYIDIDKNNIETVHTIEASLGEIVIPKVSEGNTKKAEFFIRSERFFELVKSSVPDFDDALLKERKPSIVDFELVMADDEYYYYRENTLPSDDLNQLRPQYSNVENGYGIFASRVKIKMTDWAIGTQPNINTIKSMPGLLLSKYTQIALHNGFINSTNGETIDLGTASKRFCTDSDVVGSQASNCN